MRLPVATYRVQLNKSFDFNKLKATLPYLVELGISHVYASPVFKARSGSLHGYDILDSNQINNELGGLAAFNDLLTEAKRLGIGWIQDIVPNHVAYSPENTLISDVMKFGSSSCYQEFLDVDWSHPSPKLNRKILAPFLTESYRKSLCQAQLKLFYHDGFLIRYKGFEFPVKISSYRKILSMASQIPLFQFRDERRLLAQLQESYVGDRNIRAEIDHILEEYNQNPDFMASLLSEQVFALAEWRTAFREINYRRFFDIIDLICLRMEAPNAFETTHKLISQLLFEHKIEGLRVDHLDGLWDPEEYLCKLRSIASKAYIVVEKILQNDENPPQSWSVAGTTGYDFLNKLNGLFVAEENKARMNELYRQFSGIRKSFSEILYECKKHVIRKSFSADVDNLQSLLHQVLKHKLHDKEFSKKTTCEAIIEILAAFPVYRSYISGKNADGEGNFKLALQTAMKRNTRIRAELEVIGDLLKEARLSPNALAFIMRVQQFTGAIMAKGFEDTALYVYNRLLSLNEVGGDPDKFGCSREEFYTFLSQRQTKWPLTLNATSTHDTKRGEDARARMNVLSEIPSEFHNETKKWSDTNCLKKTRIDGKLAPSKNEEYFIYQTLVGSFPFEQADMPQFIDRLMAYSAKALREAKVNSSWFSPNELYEKAVASFISKLLESSKKNAFLEEFMPFQKKIAFIGCLNSLSQTLIKIASPGVPDFYQGTELWDLNFVDPDNRRPVDFQKRQEYLREVRNLKSSDLREFPQGFQDERTKIFEINRALKLRDRKKELFQTGKTVPLPVKGALRDHLIAFCRNKEEDFAIVVVPRLLFNIEQAQPPLLDIDWKDTFICLPKGASKTWTEIFTSITQFSKNRGCGQGFFASDLLKDFPVALLVSGDNPE